MNAGSVVNEVDNMNKLNDLPSPPLVEEAKRLLEGVTPGEWRVVDPIDSIFAANPYGRGDMQVADMRGWGHLTGRGGGCAMDEDKAAAIQHANAVFIASSKRLVTDLLSLYEQTQQAAELNGRRVICSWCGTVETFDTVEDRNGQPGRDYLLDHMLACDKRPERQIVDAAVALQKRAESAEAEIVTLRGAMRAQDEREQQAGERCGVPYVLHQCDWPDAAADALLVAQAEIGRLRAALEQVVQVVTGWKSMVAASFRDGPIEHDEVGHASRWTAVEMCAQELDALLTPHGERTETEQADTRVDRKRRAAGPAGSTAASIEEGSNG